MLFNPTPTPELPRALQHLLDRETPAEAAVLPRRQFLKLAGAGAFALGAWPLAADAQAPAAAAAAGLKPFQQPAAFVEIARDGTVTVAINRLDFGQGVQTALPLILAEELDADWSRVRSRHGSNDMAYADPLFGMHLTGGSTAIKHSFTQYRELGARTRAMLVAAAAQRWQLEPAALRTEAGTVIGPGGRRLGYGELAEAAMALPVPETVVLKDPKAFRLIGRPTTRLDQRAKSSGRQDFGIDVRRPGQLTAVIARPPVFGAKLASLDDSGARAVRGVKAVLRVPLDRGAEGVAVIADGYWPARQGANALKAQWDTAGVERVDSARQLAQYRALLDQPGPRHFDADMAPLAGAPKTLEAEFQFPYLAHAPMEPLNCTVELRSDGATLWVGSQMPGLDGQAAAGALGLKPEQVRVNVQMAGGGFGRRAIPSSEYVVEACRVARAAREAGLAAPIRTLWSREDDIRGGYYRPMHLHRARIGFDERGRVLAWDHVIVGQSIIGGTFFEGMMVKNGIDATAVEGMRAPYPLPMRLTVHHPKVNVPVLWWRSVGSTHTAFVMETLVDEIARATNQDPVAYRLALIGSEHPRHRAALQLAVDKSGYGRRTLPAGRAWGVAVHESFDSVVAYVVEASLADGKPVLHRVTAGVHCNLVVNPRTVETQVQGAALMGLATCLPGAAITLKDGVVEQSNFGDYALPRITDMPEIAVHTVPSADPPTGMGEPGLPPLAPAFANAIARLSGKPQRQLPLAV
ncbi:xanthine dehydrogenase family protein molybdopterin-binding subunit [Piscinibacter sakaiensis]|uniref:Isoquinoline 1-oxidoreductase, beta subunit n=1 Tax=Piscinibacter sakaiensis TaxID=1547922 RepID=A0A0K8P248_PISS1|nr:xanthine dehydrogenase family protein molybdopterin-binding subunit [Piscinibacter sakaiensis]GAP36678.1 isoquinoline 1-oxidoreductase, beta subunit [Piscinibacter sakaiensis]